MKTYISIMKIELDEEHFCYVSIEGERIARAGVSSLVYMYKSIKYKAYKPIIKECYSYPEKLYFCLHSRKRLGVLR